MPTPLSKSRVPPRERPSCPPPSTSCWCWPALASTTSSLPSARRLGWRRPSRRSDIDAVEQGDLNAIEITEHHRGANGPASVDWHPEGWSLRSCFLLADPGGSGVATQVLQG